MKGKCGEDKVTAYFGMRSIEASGSHILLNGEIFFSAFDFRSGLLGRILLTPPSEEAIVRDLELLRRWDFNGIRMHQKNRRSFILLSCRPDGPACLGRIAQRIYV